MARDKLPFVPMRPDQDVVNGVPDYHYDLVGRVVIQWSWLEGVLQELIWNFLDLSDDDGRLLTVRMDADGMVQLLRKLVERYCTPERFDNFKRLAETIDGIRSDRNFVVHGTWGTMMPENVPFASSLRPKATLGEVIAEGFPRMRMEEITRQIVAARNQLLEMRDALAPLRDRSPKQPLP